MSLSPFLTIDLQFDLAAIMRQAWAATRIVIAAAVKRADSDGYSEQFGCAVAGALNHSMGGYVV